MLHYIDFIITPALFSSSGREGTRLASGHHQRLVRCPDSSETYWCRWVSFELWGWWWWYTRFIYFYFYHFGGVYEGVKKPEDVLWTTLPLLSMSAEACRLVLARTSLRSSDRQWYSRGGRRSHAALPNRTEPNRTIGNFIMANGKGDWLRLWLRWLEWGICHPHPHTWFYFFLAPFYFYFYFYFIFLSLHFFGGDRGDMKWKLGHRYGYNESEMEFIWRVHGLWVTKGEEKRKREIDGKKKENT